MFDIGVNITSSQFAVDRHQVIQRAYTAGVTGMLFTGTNLYESQQASELAARYPACWSSAGVHPHDSAGWQANSDEAIFLLAQQPQVVAIGECGLDFNRNYASIEHQQRAFEAQLALAAELSMPVFLHCRDAHQHFITLLDRWLDKLPAAVLHCFTGTAQEAQQCLARGLYLGITGWVCDERRGLALRALLPSIPISQLMLETDAPYLLPRDLPSELPSPPLKGRRNEPCYLPHLFRQVAHWRGEDVASLECATNNNVRQWLGID